MVRAPVLRAVPHERATKGTSTCSTSGCTGTPSALKTCSARAHVGTPVVAAPTGCAFRTAIGGKMPRWSRCVVLLAAASGSGEAAAEKGGAAAEQEADAAEGSGEVAVADDQAA